MRLSNVLSSPNSREVLEWSAADAVRPFLWRRWRQTKLTIIPMISPPFKIHFISCDRSFYVPSDKEYGKFKNSKLYLVFWRHWISWICPSFLYLLVPFFSSIRKINSLFELIAWKRSLPTHHLGRKKKTKRRKKKRRKKEEEVAGSPSRQDPVYFPPSWQDRPLNAFQLETLLPPQSVYLMMIVSKYKTGMDLLKIPLGHGS